MLKKKLALLLALVLLSTLSAFSLTSAETAEPTELSILARQGGNSSSGVQVDAIAKYIEEKLNIRMNVDFTSTDEKLAAMLASGSLPDLCFIQTSIQYLPMIKSGAVIELSDLIASHGPDLQAFAGNAIALSQKTQAFGNSPEGVYFLPTAIVEEAAMLAGPNMNFTMRFDYYAQLGYPQMNDLRGAVDVVADMLALHPTNEDGLPHVGLSVWTDWGGLHGFARNWGGLFYLRSARDVTFGASNAVEIDLNTDTVIETYTDFNSSMWIGLDTLNYAYRKGALDPDSFTQTLAAVVEKTSVAIPVASPMGDMGANGYLEKKGLTDRGMVNIKVEGTHNAGKMSRPAGTTLAWCISSNCKTPERAMDLLNWIYSDEGNFTFLNGAPEVEWTVNEDGEFRYTDVHAEHSKDPDAGDLYGLGKYFGWTSSNHEALSVKYNTPFDIGLSDIEYAQANYSDFMKGVLAHYGVNTRNELTLLQYGDPLWEYRTPLLQGTLDLSLPSDIALIDSSIDTYMNSASVRLVRAESDEEFNAIREEVIAEVQAMGLDTVVNHWKAMIDETYAKIESWK